MNPAIIQGANLMIPGRSTTTEHGCDYSGVAGAICSHRSKGRGTRFACLRKLHPAYRSNDPKRMSKLGER